MSTKLTGFPWKVIAVLGWFIPLVRDLVSMRYLWNADIRMDGRALADLLGSAPQQTPLEDAIVRSVKGLQMGEGGALLQGFRSPTALVLVC